MVHEFRVSEVRRTIELLLSASSSIDAHVALQIVGRYGKVHETVRVSRFSAGLECNPELRLVSVSPALESRSTPTFEAFPLMRPGVDPVALEAVGPADAPYGAVLPQDLDAAEPWFIVMRHEDQIRARPCRVGQASTLSRSLEHSDGQTPSLAEALAMEDTDLRTQGLGKAMEAMLGDD